MLFFIHPMLIELDECHFFDGDNGLLYPRRSWIVCGSFSQLTESIRCFHSKESTPTITFHILYFFCCFQQTEWNKWKIGDTLFEQRLPSAERLQKHENTEINQKPKKWLKQLAEATKTWKHGNKQKTPKKNKGKCYERVVWMYEISKKKGTD